MKVVYIYNSSLKDPRYFLLYWPGFDSYCIAFFSLQRVQVSESDFVSDSIVSVKETCLTALAANFLIGLSAFMLAIPLQWLLFSTASSSTSQPPRLMGTRWLTACACCLKSR